MITKNYEMFAGDTLHFGFVLKDRNNLGIDLTGGSVVFTLRETLYGIVLATVNGTVDASGNIDLVLLPAATNNLIDEGAYKYFVYDVEYTDSQGNVLTVSSGTFKIKQGVTR